MDIDEITDENPFAGMHLTTGNQRSRRDPEQSVEDVMREAGMTPGGEEDGPALVVNPRAATYAAYSAGEVVVRATERPDAHLVGTPAPVVAAWAAVEEAREAHDEAHEARALLDHEERQETASEARRVRQAAAAGKAVKPVTSSRDWSGERRHADAVLAGLRDRVVKARAAYDAAVAQALPDWADSVLSEIATAHAKARAAVASAAAATDQLAAVVAAAQALGTAADPAARAASPWNSHKAAEGLGVVASELGRETWSRVAQGAVIDRPVGLPGRMLAYYQRRTIAERMVWDLSAHAQAEWRGLLEREQREGYRYTRHGRPVATTDAQ